MITKRTVFVAALFAMLIYCETNAALVDRPKIGLVLSGGGALGFAHTGTLKMLDSLQIPIDYIVGTSMGGIAGALYAIGYSGRDIEKLANRTDWIEIFTDSPPRDMLPYFEKKESGKFQLEFGFKGLEPIPPSGLIFGQKISLLFSSLTFPYERVRHFDELPIPFRCVAVDLASGNEVVLERGSLAKAMRSTMSIPTVFSPVEWGDSLLVDGGILNNLPVDVVRRMGAEIVIAVDVGNHLLPKEKLNTVLDVLDQSVRMLGLEQWRENINTTDILIRPDLSGFAMSDFDNEKIAGIVERGNLAARQGLSGCLALKEKLNLHPTRNVTDLSHYQNTPRIHSVQITGHTTIPFKTLYDRIGIRPGEICNPDVLKEKIAELKLSGQIDAAYYDIIPISDEYVRLMINIKEKQTPQIFGIMIDGNDKLSFSFIYQMLGLKPGDYLDTDYLSQRIMKMYGIGYFESILYDVETMGENRVRLRLHVKELPSRKLRIGVRYNSAHKLVGVVSVLRNNAFIPGLRMETEFQFAGLFRFRNRLYYPATMLNIPIYPFTDIEYRKVTLQIFDGFGHKVAAYYDHGITAGAGLGMILGNWIHAYSALYMEEVDIKPDISIPDPSMFPSWRHSLRQVRAGLDIDNLDDRLLPTKGLHAGVKYEKAMNLLGSEESYVSVDASVNFYHSFTDRHTVRFFGRRVNTTTELLAYKYFYVDNPDEFIGMGFFQLKGRKFSIIRMDYRYQLIPKLYLKGMGNLAFNHDQDIPEAEDLDLNFWGYGLGLKYMSIVGPVEIIASYGSKGYLNSNSGQLRMYFVLGYQF